MVRSIVEDINKVHHAFITDRVACIDSLKSEADCEHGLAKSGRTHEKEVLVSFNPGEFLK